MAENFHEYESLEDEIKEFLQNYKHKKATDYEPCTLQNFPECLIGLQEELGLFNINYLFNPFLDVENETITPDALVKFINAVYVLVHRHKDSVEKGNTLLERNHVLEATNKQLNTTINHLKQKMHSEKNESRACVATAQKISDRSEVIHATLADTQSKLVQLTKQKQSKEKCLNNEITRLKKENEKLMDKLRSKSGSFRPCADACEDSLTQLRDRERRHRALAAKLQTANSELVREVLALKEELILAGLTHYTIDK